MWWHDGRVKLRPWLIISSLTQVLLSVGIVGYISYRSGENTVSRFAEELMGQSGDRLVTKIDQYLTIPDLINRLNEDAIRIGLLDPQDLEEIHRHLILQKRQFTTITSIVYGDPAGNFRLVYHPSALGRDGEEYARDNPIEIGIADPSDPDKFRLYNVNELGIKDQYLDTISLDVRERPWYKEAVQAQQPGWSKPFEVGKTSILAINAYRPVYKDNHDLIGVFGVNVSLEQIGKFLREIPISNSAHIYIVDEHNRLIASSDLNLPYDVDIFEDGNYQVKTINPTENPNLTIKEVHNFLQSQFPDLAEIDSPQKLKLTIEGERHFIQIIPYGSELGLDWLMVIVVPESDLIEENQANLHKTIILCFVAGAIALLNSLVTSRWIVIPILRLQQLALMLPQSKNNQDFINSPIQEINDLGLILEQMAQEIQTIFTQLADSETKLQQILDYLPMGVVVLDSVSNINYINPYGMKLLGINSILEAKPGEHSQVYQLFRSGTNDLYPFPELPSIQALQGKYVFIDDLEIHRDDRIIPCEVSSSPIFNHKQEIIGCVNVSQDISDRLSAQGILTSYNQTLERQINQATETLRKNQTILQKV
jgi:PAS domain-containing protein